MSFEQGLSLDRGIGFELVPRLKIVREFVEFWENETIFKRETTHVIQHVLTPLNLTHYRLAIWHGGFAYRIREPSGIRM